MQGGSVLKSRNKERRDGRVESKSSGHGAGYDLFIFAQIRDGSQGEAKVGNLKKGHIARSAQGHEGTDWSPEMGT